MTDRPMTPAAGAGPEPYSRYAASVPPSGCTLVDLIWRKGEIEYWIRFGRFRFKWVQDFERRTLGFAPGSVFAFVRWTANGFGTTASRIDILRAVEAGQPCQTVPHVQPGAETLLKLHGWPRVARVLEAIDRIEAIGIPPGDVAPDYWRHLHHRLSANEAPHRYTRLRHAAWLKRSAVMPDPRTGAEASEARPEGRSP
ncbi:Protein of unknown function [Paracoccus pantotrophus]|nr:Protein of unknown function [Paracoccus pantotrophus]